MHCAYVTNECHGFPKTRLSLFLENLWDLHLSVLLSVLSPCVCLLCSCAMFRKNWSFLGVWHPKCCTNPNTNTGVMLSHFSASRLMNTLPVVYICYSKEKRNNATLSWFLTSAFTPFHLSQLHVPWHLMFSDSATITSPVQKSLLLCFATLSAQALQGFYIPAFQAVTVWVL